MAVIESLKSSLLQFHENLGYSRNEHNHLHPSHFSNSKLVKADNVFFYASSAALLSLIFVAFYYGSQLISDKRHRYKNHHYGSRARNRNRGRKLSFDNEKQHNNQERFQGEKSFLFTFDNQDANNSFSSNTNRDEPSIIIGNDIEDESQVPPLQTKEVVKNTTSSKKKDVPPPSADKSRANKNRPKVTGNEAAFRDRNTGHAANKNRSTEPVVEGKKGGNPNKDNAPGERRSRSGKTDSGKKLKQAGWSDKDGQREIETEETVEGDVADEFAEDREVDTEEGPAKKSLQEYLAEVNAAKGNNAAPQRVVAPVDGERLVKSKESFIPASVAKKEKQKARKEKQTLEFDATFSDEVPKNFNNKRASAQRGGRTRGGARGGTRGGAPKGTKKPFAKPAVLDDSNFPAL